MGKKVEIKPGWRPEEVDQQICSEILNSNNCVDDCDKCDIIRKRVWDACIEAMEKKSHD
jgi:hypothetical protein